jgi:limonene-1,2-epoxide hydrolase
MNAPQSTATVLRFINSLNEDDFTTARECVTDDLTFTGVMGTRHGADAYFTDMERMKLKYNIKKVFADGNDVCLWYDVVMDSKPILSCGWYQLEQGRIRSFQVVFDPRPLLEPAK